MFRVLALGWGVQGLLYRKVERREDGGDREREFFINNLLVRIHSIIKMTW